MPWSDLVGILFFHSGNCIDTVGMLPLFDTRKPFSTANLPVYGISIYCLATWVLVAVNLVAYLLTRAVGAWCGALTRMGPLPRAWRDSRLLAPSSRLDYLDGVGGVPSCGKSDRHAAGAATQCDAGRRVKR